jgi:hypothetical protein
MQPVPILAATAATISLPITSEPIALRAATR